MVTEFYAQQKIRHPKAVVYATELTRTGKADNTRRGGPGTRRKNPKAYDAKAKHRADLSSTQWEGLSNAG